MILLIISVILVIIAGVANAAMDKVQFHYSTSIFAKYPKLNPAESWKNKWKNGDPKQGEAFLGSSTIFVSRTDFWHRMKKYQISALILAAACGPHYFNKFWLDIPVLFVGMKTLYSGVFHVFFTYVFNKR